MRRYTIEYTVSGKPNIMSIELDALDSADALEKFTRNFGGTGVSVVEVYRS